MYKTLRLVRISLLISTITKSLRFFSGKLFYKSNTKLFSCVCIAWYEHSRDWENSRQLRKASTSSRVCMTVLNSANPSRVYIRLCKYVKRFLWLNYGAFIQAWGLWFGRSRSYLKDCFWLAGKTIGIITQQCPYPWKQWRCRLKGTSKIRGLERCRGPFLESPDN